LPPIAARSFKLVGCVEPVEPSFSLSGKTGELLDVFAGCKSFGFPVSVAHNHSSNITKIMRYVKHKRSG